MKTTKTDLNYLRAIELLDIRAQIAELTKREKELKAHFSDFMGNDSHLLVKTAVMITKHEQSRCTYDSKALDAFFKDNGIDSMEFKKVSTYSYLKVKAVA